MKEMQATLIAYKRTDTFDQDSIPKALLNEHSTKAHVWGKIIVQEGKLLYTITNDNEEHTLTPDIIGIVEPKVNHLVAAIGKVKFYVEFYK